MPMVRHYGVCEDAHVCKFPCFSEEFLEELVVFRFVEDLETTICAIDNVIDMIGEIEAWLAGHADYITPCL